MATIHANSAREAVTKLCTLPLLAGPNVSDQFTIPAVASCLDVVVHCTKDPRGRRRVSEIVALPGRVESDVIEIAQIFRSHEARMMRAEGYPPHMERFAAHGYDLSEILGRGPDDDVSELRGAIDRALHTGDFRRTAGVK
jgi:pilus assembly protein CpaF